MKHSRKHSMGFVAVLGFVAISGFGLASARAQTTEIEPQSTLRPVVSLDASVKMIPYRDPWLPARERWRDIADNPLTGFQNGSQAFSYRNDYSTAPGVTQRQTLVTLSYSSNPPVPYFIGRIDAKGLKPNFAYQLKLVGKPVKGTQGWGKEGDALANERLGYAGRWWCGHPIHASGTNFDDNHYLNEYKNALPGMEHNMYGYIYLGEFVTDGHGDAHADFFGDHAYHISWAAWQGGAKDVLAGRFSLHSNPSDQASSEQYGYGPTPLSSSVTLHYEKEPGRTQPITLPPGTYHCRFLITEETFHNPVASTPEGGYWKTVLASEDLLYDQSGNIIGHDTEAANDVVFTVASRPDVTMMRANVTLSIARPATKQYQATAQITVADILGRRIRGAKVIGYWSGLHRTTGVSANTNSTGIGGTASFSDGVAQFSTPIVKARRGDYFRFIVTDIVQAGRTWNRSETIGAQMGVDGK